MQNNQLTLGTEGVYTSDPCGGAYGHIPKPVVPLSVHFLISPRHSSINRGHPHVCFDSSRGGPLSLESESMWVRAWRLAFSLAAAQETYNIQYGSLPLPAHFLHLRQTNRKPVSYPRITMVLQHAQQLASPHARE